MVSLRLLTLALCLGLVPIVSGAAPIYDIGDCLVRFQTPSAAGQTTFSSRVRQTTWNQDADDVARTIEDFFNNNGRNVPLWLKGNIALLYAGFITSTCIPMEPQSGLDHDDTAVSIILPHGVARLQDVAANEALVSPVNLRRTAGIVGINGQLLPSDYVYAVGWTVKNALQDWQSEWQGAGRLTMFAFNAINEVTGEGVIIRVPII